MKKSIVFFCALFLIIHPVSAIEVSLPDANGMGMKDDTTILVVRDNGHSITEVYTDGGFSSSLRIVNCTSTIRDVGVDLDGNLVWSEWTGSGVGYLMRAPYPTGYNEYEDIADGATVLAAIDGGVEQFVIDGNGNYWCVANNDLYEISQPFYDASVRLDNSEVTGSVESVALHPDGILVGNIHINGHYDNDGLARMYLYDPDTDTKKTIYSYNYDSGWSDTETEIQSMCSDSAGNVYFFEDIYHNTYRRYKWFNYTENLIDNTQFEILTTNAADNGDCVLLPEGVVVASFPATDNILTLSTPLSIGGYSSFSSSSSSSSEDSSSDNPLLNLDSPEDAKEVATNYSGITWILLIGLFLMAAMGGKN